MRGSSLKVFTVVVALGLIACGLLVQRQARLQAAHELARTRLRMLDHDAELLKLRSAISEVATPWNAADAIEPVSNEKPSEDAGDRAESAS